MGFLNKIFGTKQKTAALKEVAGQFDVIKDKYLESMINGLSDPDEEERKRNAIFIWKELTTALDLDDNLKSKELSLATVKKLVDELRPPQSGAEMNDLENAVFHYSRMKILHKQ